MFSSGDRVEVTVFANGPCRGIGSSSRTIRLSFLPCHLGFQLLGATCICDRSIQQFTNSCDVRDGTIERSADARFGGNTTGVVTHPNCPFIYCTREQIRINLNNSDNQCAFNRTGTLCGQCRNGLSLALGIARCEKCTSVYLALLLPLALAGVLLVAFILYLQLTVAVGTINGLIFYANIVAVDSATFFPNDGTSFSVSRLFIAWLNLDLGINTCFYYGMDTAAKVGLQFVFPVYVWLLVGGIIISSHYSTLASKIFGRNPVAVLSTLVLLSYTKLLRTIIAIFSFTFIDYPDDNREAVWLYDANIRFLGGAHIALFPVALIVLVFLFIPYTLYLTFGQCILAKSRNRLCYWMSSRRLRPFLDAYHAPFQLRHRYWFGVLLLVRCILFLVTAFNVSGNSSVNLLPIITALLGILAIQWVIGTVYRHKTLDVLELFYLLNLGSLSVGSYHILVAGGDQDLLIHLSVGAAFTVFVGIIIYHIVRAVKDIQAVRHCMNGEILAKFFSRVRALRTSGRLSLPNDPVANVPTTIVSGPPVFRPAELRESLLTEQNNDD